MSIFSKFCVSQSLHVITESSSTSPDASSPLVWLPVDVQQDLGWTAGPQHATSQTQGRDQYPRAPGHSEAGRDLSEHRGRLPQWAGAQTQAYSLLAGGLHLPQRWSRQRNGNFSWGSLSEIGNRVIVIVFSITITNTITLIVCNCNCLSFLLLPLAITAYF